METKWSSVSSGMSMCGVDDTLIVFGIVILYLFVLSCYCPIWSEAFISAAEEWVEDWLEVCGIEVSTCVLPFFCLSPTFDPLVIEILAAHLINHTITSATTGENRKL